MSDKLYPPVTDEELSAAVDRLVSVELESAQSKTDEIGCILFLVKQLWSLYPDLNLVELLEICDINRNHTNDNCIETLSNFLNAHCPHPGIYRGELCLKCGMMSQ